MTHQQQQQQQQTAANEHKAKGNDAIGRKDYGAAEGHYTKGIECFAAGAPTDADGKRALAVLYSNRAQARILMKKKAEQAIDDCGAALELCPAFLKSHLRRATANAKLGNFEDAGADMTTLLAKSDADLQTNGVDRATVETLAAEYRFEAEAAAIKFLEGGEKAICQVWAQGKLDEAPGRRFRLPESGVIFEILEAGDASKAKCSPTLSTKCSMHYEGKLRDGTVFDSSIARKVPLDFAPSEVILGWQEVMNYMVEGDVWHIWVPHDKAYGKAGTRGVIPGYATLQFEMAMLKVIEPETAKSGAEARAALAKAMGVEDCAKFMPAPKDEDAE